MDESQDTDTDLPAEELFVRKCRAALETARCWSQMAADTGLDALLTPLGVRILDDVRGRARRRDVLAPECRDDILKLAAACSQRLAERGDRLLSPSVRQRAIEAPHPNDLALSEHSVELLCLAEAIDEALDLQEALRIRQRTLAPT